MNSKKTAWRVIKWLCRYLFVALLGFVGGGLLVYIMIVRNGPSLELWHTEVLSQEFTADKAENEIPTFEQYLELEDKLFQQLNEKIYQQTESGPEFELARYSAGSLADPRDRNPDWNRTFELTHDDPAGGVLLLHGMSDSPYSLRALGESLHQRGYCVVGLRLPGHGTVPSELLNITWEDMAAAVGLAMKHLELKSGSKPLHIVGYSTGAPLALDYVLKSIDDDRKRNPASLVLVSPSIGITPVAALAKWKGRMAMIPGMDQLAWTQILPEFDPFRYNSFTANAGAQVHRLTRSVTARIKAKAVNGPIEGFPPTLVFLSTVDATVSVDAVIDNLLTHLATGQHELVLFDINRTRLKSSVMVADPGPLTARLLADDSLPFHLTLIANESVDSTAVVCHRKTPHSTDASTDPLNKSWPRGVVSLSHIALSFPPNDPLYGQRAFAPDDGLHLGQLEVQGERDLLRFPAEWLLRLRHNPFYEYFELRALQWIEE